MAKLLKSKGGKLIRSRPRRPKEGTLRVKDEAFAQAYAGGMSGAAAYKLHHAEGNITEHTAQVEASSLLRNPDIARRIKELETDFSEFLEKRLGFGKKAMGSYLVDALRTPIREVDDGHVLAQEKRLDKDGNVESIKMYPKADAADKLIKLAGWYAKEEVTVTHTTTDEVRDAMKELFSREK